MEVLNYLIISFLTYLGLLVGIILSGMAKEELKPGKKYFVLMHNIVLAIIFYLVLNFFKINALLVFILPLVLVSVLFFYKELYKKSYIVYLLLGLASMFIFKDINYLIVCLTLIFFYGFLISALNIDFNKKNYYKILYSNLGFFVCLFGLFL
jgi:hypothetical protein